MDDRVRETARVPASPRDLDRVHAILDGKPEAFHRFYEEWMPLVYAWADRRTTDRAAAEALCERVLERALRELPRFDGRVPLARWMLAVARMEFGRHG